MLDGGGDFLWRWGNPQMYNQNSHQKLFLQHDVKWIGSEYEDEGKISVFNNLSDTNGVFSSIHIIETSVNGLLYETLGGEFLPNKTSWSWNGSIFGRTVFEGKKSGCQFLKNGNALICETSLGQFSEINRNGEHLWTYKNPIILDSIAYQYAPIVAYQNVVFRAEKYPLNYPGFIGKDLTPQGTIENLNTKTDSCDIVSSINNHLEEDNLIITTPIYNNVIHFKEWQESCNIYIMNLNGKMVLKKENFSGANLFLNQKFDSSLYFLIIEKEERSEFVKILIL